jgi:hypothetical protein
MIGGKADTHRMCHQIQMRECGPKISPINICLSRTLREEKSMTPRTEYIDSVITWKI